MKFLEKILSEETIKSLKEKIGEDLFNQVSEKASDFEINLEEQKMIPYNRFKEVNDQSKDLKSQIESRDKQLKELEEKTKGNEELSARIKQLQEENEKVRVDYEGKIKQTTLDYTIDNLATKNKVRNVKALKALLDFEKIGEDYSGLEEQVKSIKESDPYLFEVEEEPNPFSRKGGLPPKAQEKVDEFDAFRKL